MKKKAYINEKIKKFNKKIIVPGDKSISIRFILMASMAVGKSTAFNILRSEDVLNSLYALKKLSIILQPFVPHISEELWASLTDKSLCINQSWPIEIVGKENKYKIALQINGKTKEIIEVDENMTKEDILIVVKQSIKIKKNLENKTVQREIYVPGKIVNLVVV